MNTLFQPETVKLNVDLNAKINLKGHWQQLKAACDGINSKVKSRNTYFHKNILNQN
ncbi:hypothetical protein [Chryseobacterium sp. WLY505]|uniref:hypothetical protein n=1 Tax=Chryseobacterium sp. WLY505 TaxID=3068892 RepID=UPI0027968056|nr:hypothetical protein [Chryseobacterium sp. WLY505]MDQ1859003.1 hypothetical protein [Chryseobacterium sp. WLY505]